MVAVPHPAATGAESETLNDEGTRRRFARDSPLEQSGFEPLVPLATEMLIELARGISRQLGCWRSATWADAAAMSIQKWDQRFESAFLQRRVCEPSVPQRRTARRRRAMTEPRIPKRSCDRCIRIIGYRCWRGSLIRRREGAVAAAAERIAGTLGDDAFQGDAHALLMAVYKDPRQPVQGRVSRSTKLLNTPIRNLY
jgi:hypothetical protein